MTWLGVFAIALLWGLGWFMVEVHSALNQANQQLSEIKALLVKLNNFAERATDDETDEQLAAKYAEAEGMIAALDRARNKPKTET